MKLSRKKRELLRQREEILSAAECVFSGKGFFTTKIQDIADKAEYGIGTIYKHFKSKEIIFFTIIKNKFAQLLTFAKNNIEKNESPDKKLRALIYSHLEFFDRNKDIFRLLGAEHISFEKDLRGKFIHEMRKNFISYYNIFSSIYKEGIRKGFFKMEKERDIMNLCLALIGMLNFTSFYKLNNMPDESLIENADLIFNLFLMKNEKRHT